jgi:hypothetical protein
MNVKFKILLLLLLPVWACANQGDIEFKRTVVKELNLNNGAQLNVSNKYGKIVVHTWAKNQVKATVVITGFGKNTSEAQEIANAVEIQANADAANATLHTSYNTSKGNSKWFPWGDKKDSKDYVNIDYEIYVPKSLNLLVLENKFGDVITDQLPFAAKMNLSYCFYAIREASKTLELNVNYCDKGRIDKADELIIRANYSDFQCNAAAKMDIKSNYSDCILGDIGDLVSKANYCDYKIRQLGSISASGNYSDFIITNLQESIDVRMVYGEVKAKEVAAGFKGGSASLTYTDLRLALSTKTALHLVVDLKHGDLETDGLSMKNVSSIKKNQSLSYTGFTANGNEQSPRLTIYGSNSSVDLTPQ